MESQAKIEEEKLIIEICKKHGVSPVYLKELFSIEKEYADKNMSKRRGIHERMSNLILEWVEEELERQAMI
ncbi:DNA modification system-associated small protein [Paenibacillus elgii]